jgi:predicted Zn finger-like uncharacterized protein
MNVSCPECRSVFRVDPGRIPGASVRARCAVCGGVITVSREGASSAPTPAAATAIPALQRPPAPPAAHFGSAPTPPIAQPVTRATPVIPSAASIGSAPPAATQRASSMPTPAGTPGISTYGGGRPSGAFPVGGLPPLAPTGAPLSPAAPFAPPPTAPRPAPPQMAPASRDTATPLSSPVPSSLRPAPPAMPPVPPRPAGPSAVNPSATSGPPPARPALGGALSAARPINPFLANDPNAKARRLARALISDLISYFPEKKEEGLRKGTLKDLFSEEIKKSYQEFVDQIGREFAESTTHFTDALNDILANGQRVFEGNKSGVE